MNKFFTSVIITIGLVTTTVIAKDNNAIKSLEHTLEKYKELTIKSDMVGTLEYIYPAVFKITPKEMLLKHFKTLKDIGKMPKVESFTYSIVKPLKSYDKGIYGVVNSSTTIEMNITPPIDKSNKEAYAKVQAILDDPEKLKAYKEFNLKVLKMQLGKDIKMSSDENSMLVKIERPSRLIAINEENKGWKFVSPTHAILSRLKPLLPKEIVENEKEIFDVKILTKEEKMAEMEKMLGTNLSQLKTNLTCSNMHIIDNALQLFKLDNSGLYPTQEEGLTALISNPNPTKYPNYSNKGYLKELPKDGWKTPFIYLYKQDKMELISLGADKKKGGKGDAKDISRSECK